MMLFVAPPSALWDVLGRIGVPATLLLTLGLGIVIPVLDNASHIGGFLAGLGLIICGVGGASVRPASILRDTSYILDRVVIASAAVWIVLLASRIGDQFDAICTGAADKGTWVRIKNPPVEGKLLRGGPQLKVGDRLRVRLVATNVEKGFIDFAKA